MTGSAIDHPEFIPFDLVRARSSTQTNYLASLPQRQSLVTVLANKKQAEGFWEGFSFSDIETAVTWPFGSHFVATTQQTWGGRSSSKKSSSSSVGRAYILLGSREQTHQLRMVLQKLLVMGEKCDGEHWLPTWQGSIVTFETNVWVCLRLNSLRWDTP